MSKLSGLPVGKKIGIGLVSLFTVVAVSGGSNKSQIPDTNTAQNAASQTNSVDVSKQQPIDTLENKTESKTEAIPYTSSTQNDSTLASGTTKVSVVGVNGERTIIYKVSLKNGKETARVESSNQITIQPVNEVIKKGTKVAQAAVQSVAPASSGCDPNYSGCVPIASDVDCAGGSGNGPAYVSGPINVIGIDIYKLDNNGNGVGCE